jgi:hypothetical protein
LNQLDSNVARDPGEILLDLALEAPGKCVGIVGLAKNCGKTTVLNRIIREAASHGITVGVTSGGRDGELYDAITGLPKPPIDMPSGSLVALAESTIGTGSCSLDVVERLGVWTPAGEVVIARVASPGHVEVIGCNHSYDLILAIKKMRELGAKLILVDGAAGRTFLASPDIVGAFVLATGAALNGSPQGIAEITEAAVRLFQLPEPPADIARLAEPRVRAGISCILRANGSMKVLPWKTILGRESDIVSLMKEDDVALVCGRAVGEALLLEIASWLNARRRMTSLAHAAASMADEDSKGEGEATRDCPSVSQAFMVIARDPSRIAAGNRGVAELEASGGRLCVLEKAPVIAISSNPTSPWREPFDPAELAVEISKHVRELPILDVVAGLSAVGGVAYET